MNEMRLSVSKSKTFIDCKKKYKFTYIEKLPRKDWDFHILGKFCHKVLEDFHLIYINGSKEPYNKSMSLCFKNALIEFKSGMTPEMKKECWKLIDQYLKIISDDKKNNLSANVIACEKNFEINIQNMVCLNGMIDRIQLDNDGVIHVADYKTTKDKRYLKNDWFQLLTYAYVILKENPDIEKVRGSYILLRHDFEYLTKEFFPQEIMTIEQKYLDYAEQIQKEKVFEANPSFLCNYCDFLNNCDEGLQKTQPMLKYGETDW